MLDAPRFFEHYKELNKESAPLTPEQQSIAQALNVLEQSSEFNELDYRISNQEVLKAIKALKTGKSTGLDRISNDMIKTGQGALLSPLTKIFNLILSSGQYPKAWTMGKILPLHKKGDYEDPSNFRGFTLSSCLGKLFNSVINSRLVEFLNKRNLTAPEQIGFKKNHRTTDHLFIVKNLMDRYKKNKKALFICFVDFQKAFDTVWHTGLFFKLLKCGIA